MVNIHKYKPCQQKFCDSHWFLRMPRDQEISIFEKLLLGSFTVSPWRQALKHLVVTLKDREG